MLQNLYKLQQHLPLAVLKLLYHSPRLSGVEPTLQQHLPLAVLKHSLNESCCCIRIVLLQQHLPLAVLKLHNKADKAQGNIMVVATAPTACGIETGADQALPYMTSDSCNSTYRLRY